jgi:hypothetical protein
MQDIPHHRLPSFTPYVHQVFDFRRYLATLRDARPDPDLSPRSVFLAALHGFLFRLRSFQALEAELREPARQQAIGAPRPFGDDVLRYRLSSFALEPLEQMLVGINRRLKRNKAFDAGRVQGRRVAALDGTEVLARYSRGCDDGLQRRVSLPDPQGGPPQERLQYDHRLVGCQMIHSPVKPCLALEWVRPGEGEDPAAFRLLERLPELYGSRFFDILLLDALYAQAPLLKLARRIGWDVVITLKQEKRDLYQDARGLFQGCPPDAQFCEQKAGTRTKVRLWQAEGLPFTRDYPQPVRVLRAEERVTQQPYRRGSLQSETTDHQWIWLDTLDAQVFPGPLVRQRGHRRWKIENNGWNDLTQNGAFTHGFLHACRHRPRDRSRSQPMPNRGLAVVTLILASCFALFSAFALLHSKLFRRYPPSLREISRQLYRSLWQLQPPIRAPA